MNASRSLVLTLVALVSFGVSGCSEDPAQAVTEPTEIAALTQRIDELERRLAEQEKTHAAERKLMVQALEASTERLDTVLGAMLEGRIKPPRKPRESRSPELPPDRGKIAKGDDPKPTGPTDSTAGVGDTGKAAQETPAGNSWFEDIDLAQGLVIFLTVSLFLLVIVVVFFPGRLRGAVPKVEYTAIEEEAIEGLQADPDAAASAPPARAADRVAPGPSVYTPPAPAPEPESPDAQPTRPEDRPVPHELALHVDDKDDIKGLAEVLDTFLSTEPYILNEPAPQVALDDDELHLRFFALPTLTEAEHALLDEAVRRLTPHPSGFPGSSGPRHSAAG